VDTAEFEAAGLYDPAAPEATERLALLEYLAQHDVSIERMRAAAAVGSLHAARSDELIRPGGRRTIGEIAAAADLDEDMLRRVLLAAGLRTADDDFRESDVDTFHLFAVGATLFGDEALLRFTRAMGSALAAVADAAISLFLVNVEDPMLRDGTDQVERARATEDAVLALTGLPDVLGGLFRAHVEQAIMRQRAASEYGTAPGAYRLTVGFVDLVGFTPLTRELEPAALGELVEGFEMVANEVVSQQGGRVVKHIGDEVMFAAIDPVAAARIALELVARFDERDGVTPHAGLAHGVVLARGGDYYGSVVNLASRIADIAVPNEILVTEELVAAAGSDPTLQFAPAGRRQLKGFDEPVPLWSLS
jgi:adenylate cyclase